MSIIGEESTSPPFETTNVPPQMIVQERRKSSARVRVLTLYYRLGCLQKKNGRGNDWKKGQRNGYGVDYSALAGGYEANNFPHWDLLSHFVNTRLSLRGQR
jgi:hypothetical protein